MCLWVRPSHEPEVSATAKFKPWSVAELQAIINNSPDPNKDQTKFREEFRNPLGAYDPGLPNLYEFVQMVVSPKVADAAERPSPNP